MQDDGKSRGVMRVTTKISASAPPMMDVGCEPMVPLWMLDEVLRSIIDQHCLPPPPPGEPSRPESHREESQAISQSKPYVEHRTL